MVILWQDLWERQFEKILLKHGWEKIPNWECLFVHRGKGLFLSVYVDDIKLAGKKHNIDPMWKVLNKEVDLGEPTSFLDHVYLGCTQRQCEVSQNIVDNYRTMFESRISAGGLEKLPFSQNNRISSWSYDMVGHAKKCVERFCELANKTTQQLYKVSTPCIDDHHFKEEETKSVGELSNTCSQIVLRCLYLARIGRPDILWSVNKLARSLTKWTKTCDKRLNRLISPSFVSSAASSNPERTSYVYQDPERHVLDDRTGQPVETSRSNYSQDYGLSWSSQVWKSGDGEHDRPGQPDKNSWDSLGKVDPHRGEHLLGRIAHSARNEETIHDRTGRPASENVQGKANFEKFIVGGDTTEFVNKVRNQVRIRQKRMSSIAENCTEHSIIWGMFMATTLNAATFKGKNFSTMQNVVQNEENLTLKQMFDITARTIHNEEEIYCLDKVVYQRNTWTQLSLINDPVVIGLQSAKVYVFSDFVLCLGKVLQHPECNEAWKNRVAGVRAERSYRDYEDVSGESTEFEWNIFPGFTTLQLCDKISNLLSSLGQSPETITGRILFMSMFNDISCDRYDNKDECLKNAEFVKTFAKRFGIGQWSVIGPGSEKKWYPSENSPQGEWDHVAEDMLLRFAESGHPIFFATTPLSRGQLKSKGRGKVSIHFSADQDTVDTIIALVFLSISSVSTEQWQLYAMNMKATKIARGNPLYWWDSQLFLQKSKQKFLFMMKNPETTKSFCSNMFNKLNRFHQKTVSVNSVRKQDLCVLSKLDNIS